MSYFSGRSLTASPRARIFLTIPVGLLLLVPAGCSGDTAPPMERAPVFVTASNAPPSPTPSSVEPPSINGEELRGVAENDTAAPVDGEAPREALGSDVEAVVALVALEVKGRAPMTGYSREEFGAAWADVDGNGCDTRNDILARDLIETVTSDGCTVTGGTLDPDPYTDTSIDFLRGVATSADVQIDHVVALSDAWQKGTQGLDADTRALSANDPLNLLAVDGPTNQAKGDKDAASWLPPNKGFRCEYVAIQIAVNAKYELWVTQAEESAMARVLETCDGQRLPEDQGAVAGGGAALEVEPAPAPVAPVPAPVAPEPVAQVPAPVGPAPDLEPVPIPPAPAAHCANCSAARVAGAAPVYVGQPGYGSHLDRDGNGVACE